MAGRRSALRSRPEGPRSGCGRAREVGARPDRADHVPGLVRSRSSRPAARRTGSTRRSRDPFSTSGNGPNVVVSTASTPASKVPVCIWAMRSGRGEDEVLVAASARAAEAGAEIRPAPRFRTYRRRRGRARGVRRGGDPRATSIGAPAASRVDHRDRRRGEAGCRFVNSCAVPLMLEPLTIESVHAADKARADLLAVPVFADRRLGPGAAVVGRRARR